jgi:hypothetical protein
MYTSSTGSVVSALETPPLSKVIRTGRLLYEYSVHCRFNGNLHFPRKEALRKTIPATILLHYYLPTTLRRSASPTSSIRRRSGSRSSSATGDSIIDVCFTHHPASRPQYGVASCARTRTRTGTSSDSTPPPARLDRLGLHSAKRTTTTLSLHRDSERLDCARQD